MKVAIMVEGQEGVGWDDWVALARATERGGFDALMRSDHYLTVGPDGEDLGALDAWGTVNALAAITERIRLGTLVSPVTFRAPAVLAKLALTADHVSGGRIDVGMGTGWHQAEHDAFGFALPPPPERFDELERQVEAVTGLWRDYHPAPVQSPHPHLILGGQAKRRSAALAARYAQEYNAVYADPAGIAGTRDRVHAACEAAGRDPATMAISLMTGFVVGEDAGAVRERGRRLMAQRGESGDVDAFVHGMRGQWLIGTPDEIVTRLGEYAAAGLDRVMLQHLLFDDLDALEEIARDVLPAVAAG